MAARKIKAKGSGGLEVHGRTFRARYFKLDPKAPSGFVRVTEGTGIRADGSDSEDCDPLTGDPDPKRARARAELWLETRSEPYRQFIQHGRFVEDAAKLAKVAKDAQAKTEGKVLAAAADLKAAEDKLPAYSLEAAWIAFNGDLTSKRRDPATHKNYDSWYHLLTAWVEATHPELTELRHITPAVALEYSKVLLEGWTGHKAVRDTTFNRHLNCLALIWATLGARNLDGTAKYPEARLGANPFAYDKTTMSGIPRLKLEKGYSDDHRRRDLTLEEIANLLTTATGEVRVLIALGFYCGFRLGDCATLKVENIDRALMQINLRSRKTKTKTSTAIHPALARIMAEEVKAKRGYLLPECAALYNAGTTGRVELGRRIASIFTACGIETSTRDEGISRARPLAGFHSLRHSYATQLERARIALEDRRRLMGHASGAMTLRYTHGEAAAALALPNVLDAETHEDGAQDAAAAGGAITLPAPADATEGGYARACAIVDGMSKAELRKLAKYITKRLGE